MPPLERKAEPLILFFFFLIISLKAKGLALVGGGGADMQNMETCFMGRI